MTMPFLFIKSLSISVPARMLIEHLASYFFPFYYLHSRTLGCTHSMEFPIPVNHFVTYLALFPDEAS